MAPDALTSEWQFRAELKLGEAPVPGEWDALEGGDTTSATRIYRPGGRSEPEAMAAPKITGDISLERAYRGTFDGDVRKSLLGHIGKRVNVTVFAMDESKNRVSGTIETIDGILKEVTRPSFRSEADTVALYRVVVTPSGHWSPA